MSLTARHKKPGGFRKLVNSLEVTPADKREKILEAMRKEDPDFVAEVEQCLFSFDEFVTTPEPVLCEILHSMENEARTFALALYKNSNQALVDKFMKCMLPKQAFECKELSKELDKVLVREQLGSQFRIIEKARQLEQGGKFVLKKYSKVYLND